ncbi:hypothetical protein WR25_04132 [Diploscapter pachys]|uniref:Uncharacterized protein n=1 Tax=Diploscapter pachys TaxID=2018661 RepID=A0A2A2JV55_9BILA|nr:hypothetical protein WR25_04132 [Diploscapter pachys]
MFFNMGGGGPRSGGGPVDTKLYDLLNVRPDASDDDIKKSYRSLAKQYHPDKNPDHGDKFKEISFAYEILSNPEKKSLYDRAGLDAIKEGGAGGGRMSDLFSHLFGGGADSDDEMGGFPGFFMGGGGRRRMRRKFPETVYPLNISLEEAYKGKTSKLKLSKKVLCTSCKGSGGKPGQVYKCSTCKGRGIRLITQQIGPGMLQQMQTRCDACKGDGCRVPEDEQCKLCKGERCEQVQKIIEVNVHPGARHGEKIKFANEGDQTDPEIEPGDLIIVIQVKDHDVFERKGDDLFIKRELTLNEALCGFEFHITHLDGRTLILKGKPGDIIKPSSVRGILGEGMPKQQSAELKGNLFVMLSVKFPDDHFLDSEAKYKQLEACFPAVKKTPQPPAGQFEEVSLFDYDEKKYQRRGNQAYESDDEDEEVGGHGPGVQCAQS